MVLRLRDDVRAEAYAIFKYLVRRSFSAPAFGEDGRDFLANPASGAHRKMRFHYRNLSFWETAKNS